ncbi:hypothetical protein DVH24_039862 [Malus domestica]|uniref:Uncharacterized protein n=1 Tax=Malus domestica TaxID=3750 RepID=A0A498I8L9_MALDO|nr:hypothetical protein DVH24_039862 [Malus domestica]
MNAPKPWYRVRLVRGTGRDGTGRGIPSRVWCAKNGWNGLFHGTDFECFCVPTPPWNGFVPRLWNTMFYHFKTNIPHLLELKHLQLSS